VIIPKLDIFKNIQAHFLFGSELRSIKELCFECFEETLGYSVIPAVTFPAYTLGNVQRFQYIFCQRAGILGASVRMKNHTFLNGLFLFALRIMKPMEIRA